MQLDGGAGRAIAVFHIKLEPYKDYFLDLLDMVLLGAVFCFAIASFAFYGGRKDSWIIQVWKAIMFGVSSVSLLSVLTAVWYEIYSKFLTAKARAMYEQKKVSRLVSVIQRVILPPIPQAVKTSKLTLKSAVNKLGGRGKKLFGSLVNSLRTHAIRHGFSHRHMNPEILALVNRVTFSAQAYLDHCNANGYLSKKPEAVFFRKLVSAVPEVTTTHIVGVGDSTD